MAPSPATRCGLTAESGGREIGILGGLPGLQRNQMRRNRTRSTPAYALKPNDGFQVVTGGESAAQQIGDPMTPTPSHVATDELIETLERLEKEATPGHAGGNRCSAGEKISSDPCKKCGATMDEGCREYPRQLERKIESLRNHLPALISALKENQRMREALIGVAPDAQERIDDICAEYQQSPGSPWSANDKAEVAKWAAVLAALQPQGDAKP